MSVAFEADSKPIICDFEYPWVGFVLMAGQPYINVINLCHYYFSCHCEHSEAIFSQLK